MSGNSTGRNRTSRSRNGTEGPAPTRRAERSEGNQRSESNQRSGSGQPNGSGRGSLARSEDIALVCGLTEDGQGVEVIRKRGDRLETGTVRKLEAGKPIHGEVVRLRPRPQAPLVCDVEVEFDGGPRENARREELEPALSSSGPAQVATESYRKNWDAVYGRSRKPSLLN